jgi:hypothetical protein
MGLVERDFLIQAMRGIRNCAFAVFFQLTSTSGIGFAENNPCQTTQPVSTLGAASTAQGTIVYDPNQGLCWLADAPLAQSAARHLRARDPESMASGVSIPAI